MIPVMLRCPFCGHDNDEDFKNDEDIEFYKKGVYMASFIKQEIWKEIDKLHPSEFERKVLVGVIELINEVILKQRDKEIERNVTSN